MWPSHYPSKSWYHSISKKIHIPLWGWVNLILRHLTNHSLVKCLSMNCRLSNNKEAHREINHIYREAENTGSEFNLIWNSLHNSKDPALTLYFPWKPVKMGIKFLVYLKTIWAIISWTIISPVIVFYHISLF